MTYGMLLDIVSATSVIDCVTCQTAYQGFAASATPMNELD